MGRIPDRWGDYSALGTTVTGTRFTPFKVPLKEDLCRQSGMPLDMWFTPKRLVSMLKERGSELGLVIDLTNTERYYKPQEVTEDGIGYKKIFTEGHAVPSVTVKQKFFEAVDNFLEENKDNDRLIGVHCTHGLNRTGYLVCRYMIDRMNIKSSDAIAAFNQARGYNIERENYLDDLNGVIGSGSPKSVAKSHNPRANKTSPSRGGASRSDEGHWRGRRPEPRCYNADWRGSRRQEELHTLREFYDDPSPGDFYSGPQSRRARICHPASYHSPRYSDLSTPHWGHARHDYRSGPYRRPTGNDFGYGRMPSWSWSGHSPYQPTDCDPSRHGHSQDLRYNYDYDRGFSNAFQ